MEQQYLCLLETLVNIDSETGDNEGVRKITGVLGEKLNSWGFDFQRLAAGDGSEHYFAVKGQGERVLLIAHLDTVFPRGTAKSRPFRTDGDMAYGPGVSDCKSGVVTILGALDYLNRGSWPGYQIGCFFNTDEEIGSTGSREIIERLAGESAAVLVVEPSEGENITVARKGIGRFELRVTGKSAHSGSNYQDGANAILELAHKIIAVQALTDISAGITLNVGVVNGGLRPNIIPDYAGAEIDLRFRRPGEEVKVIEDLRRIAAASRVIGTVAGLSGGVTRPPMPPVPANMRLYKSFQQAAQDIGVELGTFQSGGGSDANFTAALGVPTIDGVGPVGGGHHSEDEYLVLPSLFRRIEILAHFLKRWPEFQFVS